MKRLSSILTLLVVLSLQSSPLALAQNTGSGASDQGAGSIQACIDGLPERCQRALQLSVVREIEEEVDREIERELGLETGQDTSAPNNEIIVVLSESIVQNGSEYSCGEIVSCIRQCFKGRPQAEKIVTQTLKKDYDFCIVSGKDGVDLLSNYASQVYQWIAGIVGAVCVLVIILSGVQISIGGLSQEEVSSAKDRVVRALAGLVVLFLSAFILYSINPFFFS